MHDAAVIAYSIVRRAPVHSRVREELVDFKNKANGNIPEAPTSLPPKRRSCPATSIKLTCMLLHHC
jgi:hypothetical protein